MKNYTRCIFFHFREVSELIISIIQARDLSPNQYSGTLDTYIRGILQPKSDAKFQTKVKMSYLTLYMVFFSVLSDNITQNTATTKIQLLNNINYFLLFT